MLKLNRNIKYQQIMNTNNEATVRNLIGNGTNIKGDIESTGDIRIDGKLTGSVTSSGKVVVGQNGVIEGSIKCKEADVSGSVKGTIEVTELTSLRATSRLEVELVTKQLLIETGALFTGKCTMANNNGNIQRPERK